MAPKVAGDELLRGTGPASTIQPADGCSGSNAARYVCAADAENALVGVNVKVGVVGNVGTPVCGVTVKNATGVRPFALIVESAGTLAGGAIE